MTFDEFIEHWATIYKPIQHQKNNAKRERFFYVEGYMGVANFMQTIALSEGPVILYETHMNGNIGQIDSENHTIYCAMRAERQGDSRAARAAIREAKRHLKAFWNYCGEQKRKYRNAALDGITTDDTLSFQSEGPFHDGWYVVYIEVEQHLQTNICVDPNDYIEESE